MLVLLGIEFRAIKNKIAVIDSIKGYLIDMEALHFVHFPFDFNQLSNGMFSFQGIFL